MAPKLVDYLSCRPEENGILWIRFNRPDRLNALVGTAERNGTVAKVGEYMRAGDDDQKIRVIVLTGVGRVFCAGADLRSKMPPEVTGEEFPGNRGSHEGPDAARQHFYHGFTKLHRDISLIRKPTIAMIQRARGRFGHGHGASLRHPHRLREDALHRLPQCRTDHRERAPTICRRWSASAVRWNSPTPANSTPSALNKSFSCICFLRIRYVQKHTHNDDW